jgi:hypothetical protein
MVVVELELDSLHSRTLWLPLAGEPVLRHSFSSTCKRINARSGDHLRKLDTSETHAHATGCNAFILNNFIANKPKKLLSRANSVKAYSSCIIVQCRGKHPNHHCHAAQFTYLLHPIHKQVLTGTNAITLMNKGEQISRGLKVWWCPRAATFQPTTKEIEKDDKRINLILRTKKKIAATSRENDKEWRNSTILFQPHKNLSHHGNFSILLSNIKILHTRLCTLNLCIMPKNVYAATSYVRTYIHTYIHYMTYLAYKLLPLRQTNPKLASPREQAPNKFLDENGSCKRTLKARPTTDSRF